ncbi:MAG TPA: hypothetical protein VIL20_01870 [Sandaracinaceae bacterium]
MGADEGGLRVLYRRPELCMAETRGMILMLQLGAMRVEWLPAMHAAHIETAERYGGPRPFIALCRLDPRYPIDVGFDANLPELKRAFERMLPYFRACAVIVDIDGFLGAALYRGLRFIGMLARREPPMDAFRNAGEAVRWIEPYALDCTVGPFDASHYLRSLRALEALLGEERGPR